MSMAARPRHNIALPGLCLLLSIFNFYCRVFAQDFSSPQAHSDNLDDLYFHFKTRPDIQAPKFNVRVYDTEALSPGYWFVAPYEDLDRLERGKPYIGPYIYDGDGNLVWSGTPMFDRFKVWDFRVAQFGGVDMLTGISHRDNAGIVIDSGYEFVKSVPWSETWGGSNMHEFNVLEDGKRVLVFTKEDDKKASIEQSATVEYQGQCSIMDQGFKELDITVDPPRTLFEWIGSEHIALNETTVREGKVEDFCQHDWDIHHFNSLEKFENGDYLLSSRHTDTIFRISHVDGSIVWRLGGTHSNFTLSESARFSRQHHARILEQSSTSIIMSIFDNAAGTDKGNTPTHDFSRALVLSLDLQKMHVELLVPMDHPNNGLSTTRGSHQVLPNGNHFVGWSERVRLTEHDSVGRLLLHANMKVETGTYRSYKFPWVGQPKTPPNVYSAAFLAGADRLTTMVYVSWNGATEVTSWRLYESDILGQDLRLLNETSRRGFETDITHDGMAEFVTVEALDAQKQAIGRSEVVQTLPPVENAVDHRGTIPSGLSGVNWTRQAIDMAQSPLSAFMAGFVACVVIFLMARFARRSKSRQWRRSGRGSPYEGLHGREQEGLGLLGQSHVSGQEMDDLSDEGIDGREKIT